ncbi:OLC1v1002171C1 [Oldenlandia corymbosa var. corymbosa]|uniref:OLC1v1002171C1 n=1 Tax=Oldenlandia corymbosa var. corymbosa TaxID=529605 RepID=A0AAV1D9U8_OLDCO|nr:OLC1v1002171C1 [Oldenlandia corymbosa var. corymbosa]
MAWHSCLSVKYDEELGNNSNVLVRDLIDNEAWNLDSLQGILLQDDINEIESKDVTLSNEADDWIWQNDTLGKFSLKSAFNHLQKRQESSQQCTYIWDKRLQLKISIFMWRLHNKLLPFADVLMKTGLNIPSVCSLCRNHVESIRHNFFEFSYAKHWRHFGAIMVFANNEILDFDDLSSTWWTRRQSSKLTWKLQILLPSLICWQLWKCRTKAIFESTIISPHIAVRLIVQDLHIMAKAVPFKASSAKDSSFVTAGLIPFAKEARKSTPLFLTWTLPTNGIKINVDGSSIGNPGDAGCGVVIRDMQGKVILTEAKFIGTASNFQAEVESLVRGMQLCQSLRFTQIEAETDSKTLVNILANPTSWPWRSKHSLKKNMAFGTKYASHRSACV